MEYITLNSIDWRKAHRAIAAYRLYKNINFKKTENFGNPNLLNTAIYSLKALM